MIREVIVTTVSAAGKPHVAPFGLIAAAPDEWVIAPFHPSTTLDNLRAVPFLVANYTDDVRIFAGCLIRPAGLAVRAVHRRAAASPRRGAGACGDGGRLGAGRRATAALPLPDLHRETHAPFEGMNRAKAAVVEGAILVSRLGMLPREKVDSEIAYLEIAICKTADEAEREAWGWLMEAVRAHYGDALE